VSIVCDIDDNNESKDLE